MANITINTTLKEVKSGNTATVTTIDEKCKTAIITYPDGTTKAYSITTLKDKRRFEVVEVVEEVEPLIDLDNPVTEEEAEELGMITGEEALEQAVIDPEPKKQKVETGRKSRITITYNGESKTPSEWAEQFGMDAKRIRLALRKGKTPEEIFHGKNN